MSTDPERPSADGETRKEDDQVGIGDVVAGLLDALSKTDLVFLARDEPRAAEAARALKAGAPDALVLLCPASDTLPGESAPATPSNAGQRSASLRKLREALARSRRPRIALVTTGEAAGRLLPPPGSFDSAPPTVDVGAAIDIEAMAAELEQLGYLTDERVDEPGEVAVRGQVIDIFPADAGVPYRIEIQDQAIVSIRSFDPVTQLTTADCQSLELGRASEPELGQGVPLLDHLPGAALILDAGAEKRRRRFLKLAEDAGRRRPKRALRDLCTQQLWNAALEKHQLLELAPHRGDPPPRFVERRDPLRAFSDYARKVFAAGEKLLLLGTERDLRFFARRSARTLGREPVPVESWDAARQAEPGALLMLQMPLPRGLRCGDIAAIAAADLLGSRAERDDDQAMVADAELFRLGEIKTGDVVVHEDHGLCIVSGLETLSECDEAIVLRFAGEARRLVSISDADRIWRYGAEEGAVALDKLDGSSWHNRRGAIDAAVAESARHLTEVAAERLKRSAPVLEPDIAAYERFSAGFPFAETRDQARAIAAVREDLAAGRPMDRLVVGDVGYGKTEVALRAAALAAFSGKQVALAAPTTVLVRQHLETFSERFEGTGIEVAGLSRLSSPAEKKAVKAGLADGSIRVVIGTGAVAGKGIDYADLGLVIIDEEQRFGAADKSRLRQLGADHVLTLSATPIPRTLQNALVGLQSLSVIATPPARRQPIRTSVAEHDDQLLRTALLRERSRGGQSFVVVPRIEDMAPMADRVRRLVPELELLEAHGKMPVGEIDDAMVRFGRGDGDVLLATNIIEAGLDVPRANTMLVWRADRFGLSQLHQLRGRVGRGARRGQVILLTEAGARIAPRTLKRLATLQAFDRLGAGFAISARDLDMRGAGDLLGEEQAGHVKLIGVDLYQQLLERALRQLRGEDIDDWAPVLSLGVEGRLPESWIPEEDLRIGLYVRLARLQDFASLDGLEQELVDRFGEPPQQAETLLSLARLKILARRAMIQKVDAGPAAIALTPHRDFRFSTQGLGLKKKDGRLLRSGQFEDQGTRLAATEALLVELDPESEAPAEGR